jgi:hypothetical protein
MRDPNEDVDLQLAAVRSLHGRSGAQELLGQISTDERREPVVRAEAVMGLDPNLAVQRSVLVELALRSPRAIRQEALRTLRGVRLDSEDIDRLQPLAAESGDLGQLVQLVLQPLSSIHRPSPTNTTDWLARLKGDADAEAGGRIVFHPRAAGCSKCHRIGGRGAQIGPSFQRSAGVVSFTRHRLLESILQPSKEVALGYVPFQLATTDGKVHVGIPKTEDDDAYYLYDAEGREVRIPRSEIEVLQPSTKSIMPDGLADRLTDSELRDVIAFLMAN